MFVIIEKKIKKKKILKLNSKDNDSEKGDSSDSKRPILGGFTNQINPESGLGIALKNTAISAIESNFDHVLEKFCLPAGIDHESTASITSQIVKGTNFKVILNMTFSDPTQPTKPSCDFDQTQVQCEVVIYLSLGEDREYQVTSAVCSFNDGSLNDCKNLVFFHARFIIYSYFRNHNLNSIQTIISFLNSKKLNTLKLFFTKIR